MSDQAQERSKQKRPAPDPHEPKPLQSRLQQLNERLMCYEDFLVELAEALPPADYGVCGYNDYQLGKDRVRYDIGLDAKNLLDEVRHDDEA